MCDEAAELGAAANLGVDHALDPRPSSPAMAKLPYERAEAASAECTTSESSKPSDILFCDKSREQVAAELQPHLAAAEERVSKVLQHVVLSVETRLVAALRQAAIDIVEKLGKEASACLAVSERKAAVLGEELNSTKQRALSMLMRLKHLSDTQIAEAEEKISIERRRAQEAEANLLTAHESIKRLKAELKHKGQLLEELQRSIYAESLPYGLQTTLPTGSDVRKRGGSRLKGPAGEKLSRQTVNTPCEQVAGGFSAFGRFANGVAEFESPNTSTRTPSHALAYLNAFTSPKIQMGVPAMGAHLSENNFEATDSTRPAEEGCRTEKEPNILEGEDLPTCVGASIGEGGSISCQTSDVAASCHTSLVQAKSSPSSWGPAQHQLYQIVNSEIRLTKKSDEGKSCLMMEGLLCNKDSFSTPMDIVEEKQSNVEIELHTASKANHWVSDDTADQEADISINCTEKLEFDESPERREQSLPNELRCSMAVEGKVDGSDSNVLQHNGDTTEDIQNRQIQNEVEPRTREGVSDLGKVDNECSARGENSETRAIVEQDGVDTRVPSPERVKPDSDRSGPSSPVLKSSSKHRSSPSPKAEDKKLGTHDFSSQVLRRKRKQSVLVAKFDCKVKDRNSKRLQEGAVTGAFDHLLAAAEIDTHISSRDSRRLMQGARQLFSLAESKWR